ncbi:phasin family protein [Methylosinus sp. Sm6]|uniref:phasin family protein n=1 Tax=Methylosinus sp. Sm6 TaxID=2866948 RepID=UPI001C99BAB5|nr:phasin family protein [Methylosinus sp. Sm6]MBY6243188.1 phasin family protein [Methylosinus sp. Sm6]
MATHFKGPTKPRAPKVAPISLKDELDADEPVEAPADTPFAAPVEIEAAAAAPIEEPLVHVLAPNIQSAVLEPQVLEPQVLEPVVLEPEAPLPEQVVVAVVTASPAPPAGPATIDASALPLKTLDLFNENAAAVLDFALALGAAKSVGDALELQSRFASERYSSLVRQAGEFAELTRRLTFQSAPFKLRVSTFVA